MEKTYNQKLKLLYLVEIFEKYTDEDNSLTVKKIISLLQDKEISVERKTLYKDIELLENYGYDIVVKKEGKENSYFLATRNFELAEVKMLIDVIQASKFLTVKKAHHLIGKLKTLVSKNEANKIQRQIYSYEANKYINETIYTNIDAIHNAIANNKIITYNYWQWDSDKKMKNRHNNKLYTASPFALVWNDENYYLVAYDNESEKIKNYRVDKMRNVQITNIDRKGHEQFKEENIASYSKKIFSMYGGKLEKVTLQFTENMIGVIVDRFGAEVKIHKLANNMYEVNVEVMCSDHFLGWILSLGGGVKIINPENVKEQMRNLLKKSLDLYEK